MHLFQSGDFKLHSGEKSKWKIDCDALTDADLDTLAAMIAERVPAPFGSIWGIPSGGITPGQKLWPYCTDGASPVLIVDDVLTTGKSMEEARTYFNDRGQGVFGAVIFARGPRPSWVKPLFKMD